MLDTLREMEAEASTATIETPPESGEPTYRLARVTQVVTSDPTYGPHLLVVLILQFFIDLVLISGKH